MKYRDGFGIVDAIQWNGWCVDEVKELAGENIKLSGEYEERIADDSDRVRACWEYVTVKTVFGERKVGIGEYIVRKNNRIFVINRETFMQFYYAA